MDRTPISLIEKILLLYFYGDYPAGVEEDMQRWIIASGREKEKEEALARIWRKIEASEPVPAPGIPETRKCPAGL